ncbi:MAG: BREX system Lon protease-like protein BrxL [Prevotella sp.]|uniref:BREX system Lon protease-like protein BrxL n=1 Tax=Hallella faecis TaxID=2841596 RepID=A0ABV1FMK6_9BACT|nr:MULTISPECIES: BREX system Lon protease-like protein BrxL [Prevotellaceae]MCI6342419.1 BREX system Lon protease-like protein BrxL [Prevotella sp.]MDD7644100.1 BREX system Lon protease-like protein BrxL [Leyella stercorea]KIP63942.1 ATP-dependent Lon protease [Prevotella pectinovora]MBU0288755.1 BREX system Lon protease-like protein BrxL [Hallella faecis]MDY4089434.1 BREX system Lon protease-like protein BrxL [Prevotella sp.]
MNALDIKLNEAFPGKVVRKDLLHEIKRAVNVPSFVLEFLLSRYCASEDPEEIEEGKKAVLQTIEKCYVRPDESNKAQAIVEQKKRHKFIDKIHVKYVEREKRYWAEMENFASKRIAINSNFYQQNEKLLESGIWAEVTLAYNEVEEDDYAFFIEDLRPIQIAHFDEQKFFRGRERFTTDEWIDVLIRSIGIDPNWLAERSRKLNGDKNGRRLKFHILSRFLPLVQSNYNSIELGGRSTGKSYFYSEFSPYSTLLSGGQASTATLLYNNQRKQVGAVGFWDNVAFDEVAKMKIKDADTVQIMKDYMANGRFSRGREVTGYASFSFVGNFDLNIPRIVNSYDHDLLVTLPEAFDLAVIDRIYNYIPGWEIPKIDDSAYNNNFGLITDYMSEALHYLFVHDSDYVGVVNSRLKKGDNIEGRDNRALQKTISGFIKLLFPTGQPTDEEFDEIVEYAIEGRRRVKEQLNKRKPDEEYARINMSYINKDGQKVVVYCPESKYSIATQNPRKDANVPVLTEPAHDNVVTNPVTANVEPEIISNHALSDIVPASDTVEDGSLKEKTVDVQYGDTGYGYDDLFAEYLKGASIVMLEEPYLTHGFQMTNLVRFVELLVKIGDCKVFRLVTKPGETPEESTLISDSLQRLKNTLDDMDDVSMTFEYEFDENSHDRYIRTSNNWDITLGRGLHFYQNLNPNKDSRNFFQMGTYDLSLRPCLKTRFTFMKRNAKE